MPSRFGYWDMRGLGQGLRFLLTYAGEDFEDVRYVMGDGPDFSKGEWLHVKNTLGLSFPNLPYYIDDDVNVTNSLAIYTYLGRKHNLDGNTTREKADCDMCLGVIMDFRMIFAEFCYGPAEEFKTGKESYLTNAKPKISTFNDYLGDKSFFVGPKATVCDFFLYEVLDEHKIFEPTILDDFPRLQAYCSRFESLPRVKELVDSGKVKATPVLNKLSNFT